MKSNLLINKINELQKDYQTLLTKLLPSLKASRSASSMDEINVFWYRHIEMVQLYLRTVFPSNESYVFTASTFLDYDDSEHLPFLLIGEKHVLDDPLCKYAEMCNKMPKDSVSETLYNQIVLTVEDNIKILENCCDSILILPMRLLNQSVDNKEFYEIGLKTFLGLFDNICSLNDYFNKCINIDDIINYAKDGIETIVMFSETDDSSLSFSERYKVACEENHYMLDDTKTDGYNFFMLVFGCIQQAIDIIVSCLEYGCIPYVRYPVSLHYIALLSKSMMELGHMPILRYKMSAAFVLHNLYDKERLNISSSNGLVSKIRDYGFSDKLFTKLSANNINENTYLDYSIKQLVLDELEDFYRFCDK